MKKWKGFSVLISFLLALALVGCSNTTAQPGTAISVPDNGETQDVELVEQFEATRQVVDSYLSSDQASVITADVLYKIVEEKNTDYLLVDIRANSDFVNSNISGSLSIPYSDTVNKDKLEVLPKDKTLVIIDYNGHQGSQTAATLNLLGYKAVPLQYGMQSWTQEIAPLGYEVLPEKPLQQPLVTEELSAKNEYTLPELKYPEGKTQDYIMSAAKTYIDRNYKGLVAAEELAEALPNAQDYFLVDIREPQHYKQGNINGSVNIPLKELADSAQIKTLPTDQRIVLIGYDGMDASIGVRSLITLGYDAVALKYGMSYWSDQGEQTGIIPLSNQVQKNYPLTPLNYLQPSTAAAGCG